MKSKYLPLTFWGLVSVLGLASCGDSSSVSSDKSDSKTNSSEDNSSHSDMPHMSKEDALSFLAEGPFKKSINNQEIGLTEASDVGIDRDKYLNEELFPVPASGKIYRVSDYGITPDGAENSVNLNKLLSSLREVEGIKIIRFETGSYVFRSSWSITGLSNTYFVGEENTKIMLSSWGTYVECKISNNIFFYTLEFDMVNSPTISGTIKSINEDNSSSPIITIAVPEEFDLTAPAYQSWYGKAGKGSYMEYRYDTATKAYAPDENGNLFYNSTSGPAGIKEVSYNSSKKELSVTLNGSWPTWRYRTPKTGTMVSFAFTMYENHGIHFYDCQKVHLENIRLNVAGGMGIRMDLGSDFYLNRLRISPPSSSHRIMSATADGIHSVNVEGELKVTNSLIQATHDDALNIKQFFGRISSVVPSAREIEVKQTQSEVTVPFAKGDKIELYKPANMELVETYTVIDVFYAGTTYTLTVDKRPRNEYEGLIVQNPTKATRFTMDNTYIRNKRNRGILLQSRESKITHCAFENVIMGPIQLPGIYDWLEGIVPGSITISSNKFLRNRGTDINAFAYGSVGSSSSLPKTIKKIDIYNNYFEDGSPTSAYFLGCGEVTYNNNCLVYGRTLSRVVSFLKTSNGEVKGNYIRYRGDTASISIVSVDDSSTDISKGQNEIEGVA